jgi:NAD(P)-dependent dehydrogenase (short-subunit alcohol dehydrogenase family)
MKPTFDIAGQVVAITGAAGTLPSAMAWALHDCGCKLVLLGRTASKVEALAGEINKKGGRAIGIGCDVCSKDDLEKALAATLKEFGRVDALINGAGGNHPGAIAKDGDPMSFFDLKREDLQYVMDLDFMGTLLPSQVFGREFMKQKQGNIINIGSMTGIRPLTRTVAYNAGKAAVHNFTAWLAIYYAKNGCPGVRVNCIAPGFFLAEQNRNLLIDPATGEDTPRGAAIKRQTPFARLGDPEELTGVLVYLLSPSASFVTGTVVPIDGGFSVFSL